MRFQIDGHTFLLAEAKQECELLEECGEQSLPLAQLALSDPSFEDRLLVAVGAVLFITRFSGAHRNALRKK